MERQTTGLTYDYGVVGGPNRDELRKAYNECRPVTFSVVSGDGEERDLSLLLRKRLDDAEPGRESYEAGVQGGPSDIRLDYDPDSDRYHRGGIHAYHR